ncbi:MAG TPA: FadR/GntR family transcriptional regulator [Sphingomonas sp.]|nr:FadR/GntR family transcriptional regulator [Sphingomonas sp.]
MAHDQTALPQPAAGLRIHGTIAHDLGVAIVAGEYAPGDTLPGEIEFAHKLGVSRSAYREAIRMLAAKGLVESRTRTGTRVSVRERWNLLDPDILAWAFESEPSEAFIRDLFELRMIVEPGAASLAAERRGDADLQQMSHALLEMKRYGLAHPDGQAADKRFHAAILTASRNAPLITLSSSITAAVSWTTIYKQRKRALPRDPLPDHERLYEAIAAGDPDAARATMAELVGLALRDTELSREG